MVWLRHISFAQCVSCTTNVHVKGLLMRKNNRVEILAKYEIWYCSSELTLCCF